MKRSVNLLGFLATFTLSTGIMFKVMHWPFASIIMFTGFLLLNLGFLPTFFYQRARTA